MNEEQPVASRDEIQKKGLYAAIFTVVVVAATLASVLGIFADPEPDPNDKSNEQTSTTEQIATSESQDIESLTSDATQTAPRSTSLEARLLVESRRAGVESLANSLTQKLVQVHDQINGRDQLLKDLQTSNVGRQIASNSDLIEMYLALLDRKTTTVSDTAAVRMQINGLQSKLKLSHSANNLETLEGLQQELQQVSSSVEDLLDRTTQAKRQVDALVMLAEKETAGESTLAQASERYELEITAKHQLSLAQANREARSQELASEKQAVEKFNRSIAKLKGEISDSQRRVQLAEQRSKKELAVRAEEKRRLEKEFERDRSEIESILKPFITPGHTQHLHKFAYRPDNDPNARPVSFGSLKGLGYLNDSTERLTAFWRSTSHENDRPFGSFPKAPYGQTKLTAGNLKAVKKAQGYLKKYGALMVEKGMLSP